MIRSRQWTLVIEFTTETFSGDVFYGPIDFDKELLPVCFHLKKYYRHSWRMLRYRKENSFFFDKFCQIHLIGSSPQQQFFQITPIPFQYCSNTPIPFIPRFLAIKMHLNYNQIFFLLFSIHWEVLPRKKLSVFYFVSIMRYYCPNRGIIINVQKLGDNSLSL